MGVFCALESKGARAATLELEDQVAPNRARLRKRWPHFGLSAGRKERAWRELNQGRSNYYLLLMLTIHWTPNLSTQEPK